MLIEGLRMAIMELSDIKQFLLHFVPGLVAAIGVAAPIFIAMIKAKKDENVARIQRHSAMDEKLKKITDTVAANSAALQQEQNYGKQTYHKLNEIAAETLQTVRAVESIDAEQKLITRDIARLTMFHDGLPLEDQLDGGKRYTDSGGNGAGHVRYEMLKDKYAKHLLERNKQH